jgi:hypothetical protein
MDRHESLSRTSIHSQLPSLELGLDADRPNLPAGSEMSDTSSATPIQPLMGGIRETNRRTLCAAAPAITHL